MDRLAETLKLWRTTPFVWGDADCMLSVFTHVMHVTGIDGGAEWRGTYSDEAGALRTLEAAGGGKVGLAKGMTRCGAVRVDEPQRGDVVCVQIGPNEIGGLCTGDFIALRLEHQGLIEIHRRFLKVLDTWRL